MTPFAAVLLAGGRGERMGRDKALLPLPNGQLLWERQLDVLRSLEPAEIFISGPQREGFPSAVACLTDEIPGKGPLGGISAALLEMKSTRLVVLAIDLPKMTTEFLHGLLTLGDDMSSGIVPRHPVGGFYEPLAAVYPSECLTTAHEKLAGNDWSMQRFVQSLRTLLQDREIRPAEAELFTNWNHPADLRTRE